jgi:diketogulonate reductase-like aldo/keto reductase
LIPSLAFGLYKIPADDEGVSLILQAIRAGYRHFDCASIYGNEAALGKAVRLSGVPREEFFICSKVWNDAQKKGVSTVRTSIEDSLRRLECDYIDLMYVHWPVPSHFVETYKVLQEFHRNGQIRNLGISNFGISEFEELMASDGITMIPAVNQIEISPFMYRPRTVEYFQDRGVVMVASKALHRACGLDDAIIQSISTKHNVTAAQVLIRWGIQKGLVVVAKTSNFQRMAENRSAFGFSLTSEEMTELDSLTTEDQILVREQLEVERKNNA